MLKKPTRIVPLSKRFRGFLPVVIDVETGGFNPKTDALLELAAIPITIIQDSGLLTPAETHHYHIQPFEGAHMDPAALEFTGIKPDHPFRFAVTENEALCALFDQVEKNLALHHCRRALLVGHNASFDHAFLRSACERNGIQKSPFHRFTTIDTASLSAIAYGQTVLAKALKAAKLAYNPNEAHSALYDAERTASLFCTIANRFSLL